MYYCIRGFNGLGCATRWGVPVSQLGVTSMGAGNLGQLRFNLSVCGRSESHAWHKPITIRDNVPLNGSVDGLAD